MGQQKWTPSSIAVQISREDAELVLFHWRKNGHFPALVEQVEHKLHPEHVEVCAECGDPEVSMEAWIACNGEADTGGDPPGGTYCPTCGENEITTETVGAEEVTLDRDEWRRRKDLPPEPSPIEKATKELEDAHGAMADLASEVVRNMKLRGPKNAEGDVTVMVSLDLLEELQQGQKRWKDAGEALVRAQRAVGGPPPVEDRRHDPEV